MITRGVRDWPHLGGDMFDRAQVFTTTPTAQGWTIADTSPAGAPTYLTVTEDGGASQLTLAATSEIENVCLYQNDVLFLDLASLQTVEFVVKVAAVGAASVLTFGVISARNDNPDNTTVNAQFKIDGSVSTSAIVCETDDNTTDLDDKATGVTLAAVYKKFAIDFTYGLSDIRFYADGNRVAASTTFTMAAVTPGQNVQPFVQIQKTAATDVASVTIASIRAQYRYAYGA